MPLIDRDEPRFAEASREMRERGDYVVPYFNNRYRFDKPPLIYWTQIASYKAFGETDFAARFPSIVAAALTAVLLFAWGRRLGDERTGWWAAIIFSLCLQTFVHARAAVADMWLVFFVTAAYWAAFELMADWLARSASSEARLLKYWRLAFYVALALAFLAKGPLGWMPLVTVASMKLILRGPRFNRRFWPVPGVLSTVAIVMLWGVPALTRTNGEFFQVGIGRHVVERSFGALEGHGSQSWAGYLMTLPFYFVTVFISFFPWSIKLPALGRRLWRQRDGVDNYLVVGITLVFFLMTVVKTKLPHYTLIAFPLLALLLARHLFTLPGSPRFAARTAVASLVVALGTALVVFPIFAKTFPVARLFELSKNDIPPDTEPAYYNFGEPSLVWYFRGRTHQYFQGLYPDRLGKFMEYPGPRFVVLPSEDVKSAYPIIPPEWKVYNARGFNLVKGSSVELTMLLKPAN